MSSRRATAQSAPWATPSVRAAAVKRPTPIAVLTARPVTDRRNEGSPGLASTKSTICPTRTMRVRRGERQSVVTERAWHRERGNEQRGHHGEHRDPHRAFLGIHDTRQPRIADPRPPEHAEHQQPTSEPAPGRVSAMSVVHCVRASTKTRSKKSSSGVTCSSWRRTVPSRSRGGGTRAFHRGDRRTRTAWSSRRPAYAPAAAGRSP